MEKAMEAVSTPSCDPVDPLWTVSTFKTRRVSSSDSVYINGLQQIKVEVELLILDGETPVTLSPTERASVTIALYNTGTPLPPDGNGDAPTGWAVSPAVENPFDDTHSNGYLDYPGGLLPEMSPRAVGSHYFYVFLVCRTGVAQKVNFCATIQCDDGWIYRTNGIDTDNCGEDHDAGAIAGTPLEVESKEPDTYPIEHYPFIRKVISGAPGNPAFVHHYLLSFIDGRSREVGLRKLELAPKGMIQWHSNVPDGEFRASFTGYAEPDSTQLHWNDPEHVPVGASPLPALDASVISKTKGIVVLVGRDDIRYQSGRDYAQGPCNVTAVDAYGNTVSLSVAFKDKTSEGRLELVLASR